MNSCFGLWGDTSRGSQENILQAAALVKVQSGLFQSFGQDFRTFPSQRGRSPLLRGSPWGYVVVLC